MHIVNRLISVFVFEPAIKTMYLKCESKILIMLLSLTLLVSSTAVAAPIISSVNQQYNKLSILGSNFGLKSTPNPFYFSTFESDTVEQIPLRQITNLKNFGTTKKDLSRSGPKSLYFNYCADAGAINWSSSVVFKVNQIALYNGVEYTVISAVGPSALTPNNDTTHFRVGRVATYCTNVAKKEDWRRNVIDLGENGADKIFLSAWIFIDKGASECSSCQFKFIRIASNSDMYNTGVDQRTVLFDTWYHSDNGTWYNTGSPHVYYWNNGATVGTTTLAPADMFLWNQWQRVDLYLQNSSVSGATDGHVYFNRVGSSAPVVNKTNIPTFVTGNKPWRYVSLSNAVASISDGFSELKVYLDDIYLDTTRAHVEICDSSTWATRTSCEIQPATVWDNGQIVTKINQGRIEVGRTVYIYVQDSNGEVNSNGYPFSLSSAPPIAPQTVIEKK